MHLKAHVWSCLFGAALLALAVSCGGGTGVAAVAPAAANISLFTATPSSITAGGNTSLAYAFTGGTGTIDNGIGAVTSGATSLVAPAATTVYTLTVTDASGHTLTRSLTVIVSPTIGRAVGLDVSHYEGTIAWPKVFADGQAFTIIKATDGYRASQTAPMITDKNFATHVPAAAAAGLLVGAYHFARPYLNAAKDEADFFVSVAGGCIGAGYLPPALDLEDPSDQAPYNQVTAMGAATLSQWVRDFCAELVARTNTKPMLYMTPSFARNLMQADLAQYPLWIAYYESPVSTNPAGLGPWGNAWTFMQYSANGHVLDNAVQSPPVDLDAFNGDITALTTFIKGTRLMAPPLDVTASVASSPVPGPPSPPQAVEGAFAMPHGRRSGD